MYTLTERFGGENELFRRMISEQVTGLRVASPGIIESFNPDTQTATVQLAIREKVNINGNLEWTDVPLLMDVPIMFPRGGGYSVTVPLGKGSEVLVIFGDNTIDGFWQSGGTGNAQPDSRRHDLSDGMAIPTGISQPNKLPNVSTDSVQVRNDSGSTYVEIKGNDINLVGTNISVNASGSFNVNANSYSVTSQTSTINGNGTTTIDGRKFLTHTHTGVQSGSSNTGGVS